MNLKVKLEVSTMEVFRVCGERGCCEGERITNFELN
jgi:hypothetical protein